MNFSIIADHPYKNLLIHATPNTATGAPEVDILEAMPGFENLHKSNPNTYTHKPYYSASLQVAPGTMFVIVLYLLFVCIVVVVLFA